MKRRFFYALISFEAYKVWVNENWIKI